MINESNIEEYYNEYSYNNYYEESKYTDDYYEALAERGDIEYQDRVYEEMMRGNL